MNYRELTRKLRKFDCEFYRQGIGSHEMWRRTTPRRRTSIPNWGSKDLQPGTVGKILRDLEIDRRDFDQV